MNEKYFSACALTPSRDGAFHKSGINTQLVLIHSSSLKHVQIALGVTAHTSLKFEFFNKIKNVSLLGQREQ